MALFGTIIPPMLLNAGFPHTGIGLGSIVSSLELAAQGAAGVQRAVAYANNARVLYFEETLPVEYQPIQRINNIFKVPTFAKVGGVFIRRPYGIQYGDYTKA